MTWSHLGKVAVLFTTQYPQTTTALSVFCNNIWRAPPRIYAKLMLDADLSPLYDERTHTVRVGRSVGRLLA